eukprot:2488849-Amphidinium_carterae.1
MLKLTVYLSDMSTALLNTQLKSTIYVKPPPKHSITRILTWYQQCGAHTNEERPMSVSFNCLECTTPHAPG